MTGYVRLGVLLYNDNIHIKQEVLEKIGDITELKNKIEDKHFPKRGEHR